MQTRTPAENLLQRLLQSDKLRNTYQLVIENNDGCSKISLHCLVMANERNVTNPHRQTFLLPEKKFFT